MSNDRAIDERWIGNDLERSDRDLIDVLPWYLPGGTEKSEEDFCQISRCSGRYSNQAPPEYKSGGLPPRPASSVVYVSHSKENNTKGRK
jgi:hypothetical protein